MNANPNVQSATRNPHTGQIMFRPGQMLSFISTRVFTLGQTGVQIREGTEILYDGTKALVDGAEYVVPFLRGALKAGWLVLLEEYDPDAVDYTAPTRANITVRHATQQGNPMNPQRTLIATTESDEREVGNVRGHAQNTRQANNGYVRGQTPVNVVPAGTAVRTQRGMMVVEEQDGIEIQGRVLKTMAGEKAKNTRTELTSEKAHEALRVANNVQITPGQGITQDEMLARMTPEAQAEYLAHKDAYRSQYVSEPSPPQARRVVGNVQSQKQGESSGMRFQNSVGGGTEISDGEGEVVGRVTEENQTFEQDGIKFTTTNGPKRDTQPARRPVASLQPVQAAAPTFARPSNEICRTIAKALCADFPDNYDFSLSTKKKLARITADYEDRLDVIRAIFAAEGDEMKLLLVQEFPAAFPS